MVYGCDPAWWRHRKGLPEFTGLKVAWSGAQVEFPDLLRVEIAKDLSEYSNRMAFEKTGRIGGGGNSGFQALNLAAQLGASRVLLIGFDMHARGGVHWYGRNGWPMANNPDESQFPALALGLRRRCACPGEKGVDVVNASPFSDLKGFRRMSSRPTPLTETGAWREAIIYIGWDPREQAAFDVAPSRHLLRHLSDSIPVHGPGAGRPDRPRPLQPPDRAPRRPALGRDLRRADVHRARQCAVPCPAPGEDRLGPVHGRRHAGRDDLAPMFDALDPAKALYCVQHATSRTEGFKMDGQAADPLRPQELVELLVFNCDHPANRALTLGA
jgi:hypothetical protein